MSIEREDHFGRIEYHVEEIPSWNGFDQITRYFMEHLAAELISSVDGPDARVCEFRMGGHVIVLVHDDRAGNFFFAKGAEGERMAKSMAKNLADRINAVNK